MSTYALLMAKATREYFCENVDGAETANLSSSTVVDRFVFWNQ